MYRQGPATSLVWKESIIKVFKDQPYPMLMDETTSIPGASIYSGLRVWAQFFRRLRLKKSQAVAMRPSGAKGIFPILGALHEDLRIILDYSGMQKKDIFRLENAQEGPFGPNVWSVGTDGLPEQMPEKVQRKAPVKTGEESNTGPFTGGRFDEPLDRLTYRLENQEPFVVSDSQFQKRITQCHQVERVVQGSWEDPVFFCEKLIPALFCQTKERYIQIGTNE